jgi:LysM repeat protein
VPWHNPEFRDTAGGPQETGPERKIEGDNSQKYFTYYTIHEAGLYQQVGGVNPGDKLRFSVWMEAWSNAANDPFRSAGQQTMGMQAGIDPTGGNDPWSPNIVWSPVQESYDKFSQFVVEAVAKNNVVSVWTRSRPVYALQHNDVYVDEASLHVVTGGAAPKAKAAPAKTTKTTKIITSTKVITSASGITSTVVVSKSVVVTAPAATTKPVSGTVATKAPTTPVTGTLPIPASGTYTVVKGDSLSKIARRFGVPLATLIALNNSTDPNRIEAGMILKLK